MNREDDISNLVFEELDKGDIFARYTDVKVKISPCVQCRGDKKAHKEYHDYIENIKVYESKAKK